MKHDALHDAEKYTKDHKRKKLWYQAVTVLACVVVFCTTYALILPAITMEKQCDIPEHTHTDACYTQATSVEKKVPVCTEETMEIHRHTADCYDADGNLTCGYANFVVHQHDSACYDENGNLWCPLPEIETHEHTDSCYAMTEGTSEEVHTHTDACYTLERGDLICLEHVHTDACYTETTVLICGLEESAGHQHDESCMDENGEIICGLECSEGHQHSGSCYETSRELTCGIDSDHQHTDDCYEWNRVLTCDLPTEPAESAAEEDAEPVLVCTKPEIVLHRHTSDCFDADGNLICGQIQILEHQHSDACFEMVAELVDTETLTCPIPEGEGAHTHGGDCYDEAGNLICQQAESEGHVHGPLCYGTWELTCGMEEHTRGEECQGAAELTEEEQAQVDAVIALIDALPTGEEIEETAAAFEEAEDEEGLEAYLSEVYPQVNAAYEAYAALTDAQKAKVTNADKLLALEWIWSAATLETDFPVLTDDSARVTGITVTGISDGVTPWDENDNAGNDSSENNKIVRTFDTVTYLFEVQMASYDNTSYSEARVKLEFVLPLTSEQAVFDQTAMAWMDTTSDYKPVLTTETRTIDGVETECQVLTCYKRLLPSEGHQSVVPGTFGENVTINVKSMKNGDTFAPIFSAAMEYGNWSDEACSTHGQVERATVTADKITVSAAPKYNIKICGQSSYKSTFDFNSGNDLAKAYGDGYGKGKVIGRVSRYGIVLQLYNDNASKGFKGIELPDGNPITFDLQISSVYTVNTPNAGSGYTQGQKIDVTNTYTPLLWSCDINVWTSAGSTNSDGRVLYDSDGTAENCAPLANGGGDNACYKSGQWTATQEGTTIHVTVSGYQIDVDQMPIQNANTSGTGSYGVDVGIGCFSAGEVWIVQPYNKIGPTSANEGPNFDVVQDYGQGSFATTIEDLNLNATSVSGQSVKGTQTVTTDDRKALTLELRLPGTLQNLVAYANLSNYAKGVGVDNYRDGLDFATVGTEIGLLGGFIYMHRNEIDNLLYWGTNLTKFYGSAIEIIDSQPDPHIFGGANPKEWTVYYATKKDGTDWVSDWELRRTYEDDLVFYKNLSDIPERHLCVGLLFCFKEDTYGEIGRPYFLLNQKARVRDNMDLDGKTYMLASTSRVWTKSMFESAGMSLDDIPDWSESTTKLSSFPERHYKSGNIQGSVWYTKETYAADGSGALGTHNSDWRNWGDTLLVIGYKTGITKNLCQTSDDGTTKSTFNLDANQRVVDFKLQPRTYFDQGTTNHSVSTTVTIVDTLPKYLTYRAGSSYFGGTYTQTSANGGTQGTITGGTLREPDEIINNADGTQTLKWIIPNVTVGEDLPAIYYSADIGDRNNPDEDVPTGTTNLLNTVRITATHDPRQPTIANGNYAEAGIAVTRGTASSFGKYSKQKLVEPDGVIDYVVYFDNNSASSADVVLLDTMPYDDVNGSQFNGSYVVNSWQLDVSGCDASKLTLYYTVDTQCKDATIASLGGNDAAKTIIQGWKQATIGSDGTVTDLNGKRPVAWAILGSLDANKQIHVDMQVQLKPDQSTAGNEIQNNYYVNTVSSGETTIYTETPTVNRTLEGLTWLDDSADGIQNEDAEHRISGVKVSLWKLKDGGDANNEADYVPYCYPGTSTQIVIETGQQVSVLAADAKKVTDYELGRYKFTDMPAGTFAVKFEDGSTKISPYIASPANMGQNDTLDSDGIPEYSADKTTLQKTVILGISMPKAEEMSVVLYESKYHDSGFYERGYELPDTGGTGTTLYTTCGLLLTMAAAFLLYLHHKRRKEDAVFS